MFSSQVLRNKTAKKKKISTVSPSSQLVQVVPDNQNNTGDSSAKVKYEDRVHMTYGQDLRTDLSRGVASVVLVVWNHLN
ncbi:hypothetical protein HID58_068347 [Brassica napus]|uniref:BnaC05g40010D protein n=2 Tax=Brassica napus TaxID=3708 RepID=A0A078GG85_BRANA|nr:hypothetical protein HID58_068347 [Brassica napus]CAF1934991.1 unnamed protein product [Brassica napus]CDY23593.1 BnaC05g40010D [Brassica napus]